MKHVGWMMLAVTLIALGVSMACMPYGQGGRGQQRTYVGSPATFGPIAVTSGLTVQLPGAPQLRQEQHRGEDGGLYTMTFAEAQLNDPPMIFRIIVTEFEGGLTGDLLSQLDSMIESFLEGAEGTEIRNARPVVTQGFPGVEHELFDEEDHVMLRVQHFIGRKRVYTIAVGYAEQSGARGADVATRFFDRLTFDMGDAPIPSGDGSLDFRRFTHIFPPHDDFAVQMPGLARAETERVQLGGEERETRLYGVRERDGAVRFEVRVTSLGNTPREGLLAVVRDRRLTSGFRIRDARDTHRQGFAALAVTYESATDVVFSVYVLTMSRVYEASVTVPRAREAEIVPHRQRFFQSLRIL